MRQRDERKRRASSFSWFPRLVSRCQSLLYIQKRHIRTHLPRLSRQIASHLAESLHLQYPFGNFRGIRKLGSPHHFLDWRDKAGAHAQPPQSHAKERQVATRPTRHFSAQRHWLALSIARRNDLRQEPQNRWVERFAQVRHLRIVPVSCH